MMKKQLHVLICNDDGVYANGLQLLASDIRQFAEVDVVAPDRNRSGASNSLTLSTPLRLKTIADRVVSVEGTPTDCVHVAITGLLSKTPDMVVSGINDGSNLGDDVWYSGTVAAAIEGRFLGLPAIAVSLMTENAVHSHYATASRAICIMLKQLLINPLPPRTILNVNVPNVPYEELDGFTVTRLGTRHCAEPTIKQKDPRGHPIYWIGPAGAEADAGPGTDFYAVRHNKVSITPLRVDLTQHESFIQLSEWIEALEKNRYP